MQNWLMEANILADEYICGAMDIWWGGGNLFISNMVLEEIFAVTVDCQKDKLVGPRSNQA